MSFQGTWIECRGSVEPVAFLCLMPLMLLVTLSVLQVVMVGYAIVSVEVTAWEAVRAASVGDNPFTEVRAIRTATGIPMTARVTCARNTVTVHVTGRAPRLLPALGADLLEVSRAAESSVEVGCWS